MAQGLPQTWIRSTLLLLGKLLTMLSIFVALDRALIGQPELVPLVGLFCGLTLTVVVAIGAANYSQELVQLLGFAAIPMVMFGVGLSIAAAVGRPAVPTLATVSLLLLGGVGMYVARFIVRRGMRSAPSNNRWRGP